MPIHFRVARHFQKERDTIKGSRSLHRGVHYETNAEAVQQWKSNPTAKRKDPNELLTHHQKIDAALKDVYARTANLTKENMTMEERKEESWKQFERCGGKRPKAVVAYKQHLQQVRKERNETRVAAEIERKTGGDEMDVTHGSAIDREKKRRIISFVQGKKSRQKLLHQHGDPNPMKGIGRFDRHTNTLTVSNRVHRNVRRSVQHDDRIGAVKKNRSGRSMWDARDSGSNVNRPGKMVIRDATKAQNFGPGNRKKVSKRK